MKTKPDILFARYCVIIINKTAHGCTRWLEFATSDEARAYNYIKERTDELCLVYDRITDKYYGADGVEVRILQIAI